jgi:hypothetical protein
MTKIYYIDGEKYIIDSIDIQIIQYDISSPNDETPAFENLLSGYKLWCLKGYIPSSFKRACCYLGK